MRDTIPQPVRLSVFALAVLIFASAPDAVVAQAPAGGEFHVEIVKKGLGKEVTITKGAKEWFMMIEVTPENSVIVWEEKDHGAFVAGDHEQHDHSMSAKDVDDAIENFVNSVKTKGTKKKP